MSSHTKQPTHGRGRPRAGVTREKRFFGAAMLPMNEREYTGIMEKLGILEKRFSVRNVRKAA